MRLMVFDLMCRFTEMWGSDASMQHCFGFAKLAPFELESSKVLQQRWKGIRDDTQSVGPPQLAHPSMYGTSTFKANTSSMSWLKLCQAGG